MLAACLTIIILLGLAGCFWNKDGGQRDEKQERMGAIAAEIEAKLASRPDIVQADVVYGDYITNPGAADASIQVTAGTPFPPVQDEALRLLWQSQLDPLKSIRLAIVDAADVGRNEVLHLDAAREDKAELEQKYGPRPQ